MTEEKFFDELKNIGIVLSDDKKQKFNLYLSYLQEYNKNVNLTAITEKNEIYLKHFYDSIIASKYFKFSNQKILDIGTGAGFPGIPLLICFPNLKLTVLDSNNKKTIFLEKLKRKLNLNYTVINKRAESFDYKEKFDLVVSRAVSDLRILLELAIPLLKINGYLIAYKADSANELLNSQNALSKLNSTLVSKNETYLLNNTYIRTIIIIQKNGKTDSLYPRTYNKIKKNPL